MAQTSPDPDPDAADEPSAEYDAAAFPLAAGDADADDLEKRDRKARREKMVVVPQHDNDYGEFTGHVTLRSQSGSTYELDVTESDCSCPDNAINQPADGCKHERRVIVLMEEGRLPMPPRGRGTPETLDDYWTGYGLGQLELLAATYSALNADRDRADDPAPFTDAMEEVEGFFRALAKGYDAYDRDVTDLPERPTLDV